MHQMPITLFLAGGEDNHWRESGYMQKNEKALNIMLQHGVAGRYSCTGDASPKKQACKIILTTVK
jgi:hypothetical protein